MPIGFYLPRFIQPFARRLLARWLRTRAPLPIGRFSPIYRDTSQGLLRSAPHTRFHGRHAWNRRRLPLYSSFVQSMPAARVVAPAMLKFAWENPEDLYPIMPTVSVAPARARRVWQNRGIPFPDYELMARQMPAAPRRRPPDDIRRRHDSKVPLWLNRFHSLVRS